MTGVVVVRLLLRLIVGTVYMNPDWLPWEGFFFGLKFVLLDQLPNAFAQLFLDNENIF